MMNEETQIKAFYEALELFKTCKEFAHDRENIQVCEYHLSNYNYQTAYYFVQNLIKEYENGINSISQFNGNKSVVPDNSFWSDEKVIDRLTHFHDYIPAYAFTREFKKEVAKQIIFGLERGLK